MCLVVAEMAADDLLDVDAGGMVVDEGGGHFGSSLVKAGLIRTYETEELGEWNGVFTGNRVRGYTVQVAVGVGGFIVDISGQSIPRNENRDIEEGKRGVRDRPGENEGRVEIYEVFQLQTREGSSTDDITDVSEKE
eukprot:g32514.t1